MSPRASWFHIITMAIHRARPTRMTPVRYVGRSGRVAHASPSIMRGPMTQFMNIDKAMCTHIRGDENTIESSSYWTLVSTGHICRMLAKTQMDEQAIYHDDEPYGDG